jgi:hypothetical protein
VSEQDRRQREHQREEQIKAENLEARQRAADPVQRNRIDPSTGRTWGDAVGRGMYGDSRLQSFRDMNDQHRQTRRQLRHAQARTQGRAGRN